MTQTAADLEALDGRVADALWFENHRPGSEALRMSFIAERCEQAGYELDEED